MNQQPPDGVLRVAASLNVQFPQDGLGQTILVVPATDGARIGRFVRELGAALGRLSAKPVLVLGFDADSGLDIEATARAGEGPGGPVGGGVGDGREESLKLTLSRLNIASDAASLPPLREFLAAEQQRYRFILIGGAPPSRSGASMLLSQLASGVLLVLSGGVSTEEEARRAATAIRLSGGNLLGFVIDEPRRGR